MSLEKEQRKENELRKNVMLCTDTAFVYLKCTSAM